MTMMSNQMPNNSEEFSAAIVSILDSAHRGVSIERLASRMMMVFEHMLKQVVEQTVTKSMSSVNNPPVLLDAVVGDDEKTQALLKILRDKETHRSLIAAGDVSEAISWFTDIAYQALKSTQNNVIGKELDPPSSL